MSPTFTCSSQTLESSNDIESNETILKSNLSWLRFEVPRLSPVNLRPLRSVSSYSEFSASRRPPLDSINVLIGTDRTELDDARFFVALNKADLLFYTVGRNLERLTVGTERSVFCRVGCEMWKEKCVLFWFALFFLDSLIYRIWLLIL